MTEKKLNNKKTTVILIVVSALILLLVALVFPMYSCVRESSINDKITKEIVQKGKEQNPYGYSIKDMKVTKGEKEGDKTTYYLTYTEYKTNKYGATSETKQSLKSAFVYDDGRVYLRN